MTQPENRIPRDRINRDLRSPALIAASIFCLASAFFAIPGIGRLLDMEEIGRFLLALSLDYIDGSAQISWLLVKCLVNVLALVVPLLTAVGVLLTIVASFCHKDGCFPAWGVGYFPGLIRAVRMILYAVSVLLAVLFAVRAVIYLAVNGSQIGGVLFIFAMLLPELVLAAVTVVILCLTIRALKCAELTADNIRLNALSGKCEAYGLKSGTVWLVFMMGVASAALLVIHRSEQAAVIGFALSALGDFLLAVWLILYRRRNGQRALYKFRTENDIFA